MVTLGFSDLYRRAVLVRDALAGEIEGSADPAETFEGLLWHAENDHLAILIGVALGVPEVASEDELHVNWVGQIALNHLRSAGG